MKIFSKSVLKIFLLFSVFWAGGCFANAGNSNNTASFLFVQNAKTGILQADKSNAGSYKLILEDVSPYVIYFSDRPKRISGLITPEKFMTLWQKNGKNNNFATNTPNVGVNGISVHRIFLKNDTNFIMELTNPVYNKAKHSIIYDAHILPGTEKNIMPVNNTEVHDIVLFFDNIAGPCTDSQCCPIC